MTRQSEALRLANLLDLGGDATRPNHWEAAAELRRLYEVNQELLEALKLAQTIAKSGIKLTQQSPRQLRASMTDLRAAANMALNALEFSLPAIEDFGSKEQLTDCHRAITALYKSIAQPEQEPVAWAVGRKVATCDEVFAEIWRRGGEEVTPLYTAPPKREWVGLTDEQLSETYNDLYTKYTRDDVNIADFILIARAIEAKLKEKNA